MRMTPIPVVPLLSAIGVRVLVIRPVVARQVQSPCVTLVVIPVVIIVVIPIVDAYLNAGILRHRRGHH